MEEFLKFLPGLLSDTITTVFVSLSHNWIPLSLAILTATLMKVYVNAEKLKESLLKRPKVSILASVAFGAFTPLCACGTMSVVLGLLATALPWGPVMAFLTSSPLMSPDGFILIAGVLNFKFAIALTVASLVIGLVSGGLTHLIEKNTNFLKDQLRLTNKNKVTTCGCSDTPVASEQISSGCGCNSRATSQKQVSSYAQVCACSASTSVSEIISPKVETCGCAAPKSININQRASKSTNAFTIILKRIRFKELLDAFINVGLKQILLFFVIFTAVGFFIQSFVPTSLIMSLFSGDSFFSVPLAALIGLPLYVSGEGAIPLIKALIDGGAGEGAMMAFMITGPATSAWVIAGITAFMKKRVIGLYIAFVLIGGILIGYLYQLLIAMGL